MYRSDRGFRIPLEVHHQPEVSRILGAKNNINFEHEYMIVSQIKCGRECIRLTLLLTVNTSVGRTIWISFDLGNEEFDLGFLQTGRSERHGTRI